MSEVTELWMANGTHQDEADLVKSEDVYILSVYSDEIARIQLDRKDLKDLFNAIGNELNIWWGNVSMNEVKHAGTEVEGTPVKSPSEAL